MGAARPVDVRVVAGVIAALIVGIVLGRTVFSADGDRETGRRQATGTGDRGEVDTPAAEGEATTSSTGLGSSSCALFPDDHFWYADVSRLPVHAMSDAFIEAIGGDTSLHPDFGTVYEGAPIGIPYSTTSAETPEVAVEFEYADESDPGPYRIPPDAAVEGGPDSNGDRHVLVLDEQRCRLYELWNAFRDADTRWHAGSGATWDLRSNDLRPEGWTSADGAGLAILPALVRYEEVESGEIDHALRFTTEETRDAFVWPARHKAGSGDDPALPPMGTWLRLKADVDISGFSEPVQVVLRALKHHGMILADNGSSIYVTGVPDPRWNDERLVDELGGITGSDFEVVDTSPLVVDADSGQVRGGEDSK